MAKIEQVSNVSGMYQFYCPGCECYHFIRTNKNETPCWEFNGDVDKPTVSPSILVRFPYGGENHVCHSFIREGKIQFLGDCTHRLADKTVELQELHKIY